MALTPGTRLGVYEVSAQIGEGGMGQVYRATDTKLKRQVAIKVLPPALAADADRLARFQREAEVLASLNHPSIATIYGLEDADGVKALVMELVEGEDLSQRIAGGAIPIDEALAIARQIADALEAAHEQGIIHRDLKPANIKLRPDGTVKVLDFGLAKAMDPESSSPAAAALANSPTITSPAPMSAAGVILGTAVYMSPEQARGKPLDKRTDIWAFGVVLFEMLTGRRPFIGETPSDTMIAILERTPDWSALPPAAPAPVRRLLLRCLDKDAKRRLRDIGDARAEIDDTLAGAMASAVQPDPWSAAAGSQTDPSRHRRTRMTIGLMLLLACAAGASALLLRPRPVQPLRHVSVLLPPGVVIYPTGGPFVSLDGRRLLVVGQEEDKSRLWLRDLNRDAFEPLEGTEGATFPFWAPDGDRIGFFADRKLKKVSLDGDVVETICDVSNARGGAWGADGTIIFNAGIYAGLSRVSAAGGGPTPLTQKAPDELSHRFPVFLPDGRHFLFTVTKASGRSDIAFASLDNPTPIPLVTDASDPSHTRDGHIWFARNRAVFAQAFDSTSHTVRGAPVTVVTNVGYNAVINHADYSVANDGTLAYAVDAGREELTWIDRATGRLEHVATDESIGFNWKVSPDGERLAYSAWTPDSPQGGLMVWDMRGGVKTRMVPDVNVLQPWCIAWSPAGDRLAVSGQRKTEHVVLALSLSGAPHTQTLLRQSEAACVQAWTPDGRYALVRHGSPSSMTAVAAVPDGPPLTLEPALPPGAARAVISPDGRWIAYTLAEGARLEGYIQRFPPDGRASKFTPDEVINPVWRRDGAEIFYDDRVSSVKSVRLIVSSKGELSAGAPSLVVRRARAATGIVPFFVAPDGQRILTFAQSSDVSSRRTLSLILNWPALLNGKR